MLTLPELTSALRRFEVKTGTAQRIEQNAKEAERLARVFRNGSATRAS